MRSGGDPVLYLSNPPGVIDQARRQMLDGLAELNQKRAGGRRRSGDRHPHRPVRDGLPHADVGARTDRPLQGAASDILDLYGPDVTQARHLRRQLPAGPAAGRARRALHPGLPARLGPARQLARQHCRCSAATSIRPAAALIKDLKQRGMLDDTLVIWGGEFGRTVYCQGTLTNDNYGRDHHPPLLHHVDGRRRHQAGHDLRRDRRLQLQHRREPRPRPRPERHDPALPGHRSRTADLPLPGPRLPPDRRATAKW